jgi:positive regulator of sigma E activity
MAKNCCGACQPCCSDGKPPDKKYIFASFIIYLMPIVFMVLGYLLGAIFSEAIGIVLAIGFLLFGFIFVGWYDRKYWQ